MVSDSPGLVDFAIGLMNSVFNLTDGQMMFFEEFEKQKNCEINSALQKAFGLVEMTSGLVNVSFSLPEWQAVKMIFFATWYYWFKNYSCINSQCWLYNMLFTVPWTKCRHISYLPGLHHSTAWSVREWRGSQDQHHPTRHKKKLFSLKNFFEILVLSWSEIRHFHNVE